MCRMIASRDGVRIYYKDWGSGPAVVFSHGWPLNADAWDDQLLFLASNGYRAIAHDRRGHGRSDKPQFGNDMNTYADDLSSLMDALDIRGAALVGHSTGGGEVARYISRYGDERIAKLVLVSSVVPFLLKTPENPDGVPSSAFDEIRDQLRKDRSQYYRDLSASFYGANRPESSVSEGIRQAFWLWSMQVSFKAAYECVKAFSETDFRQDLPKILKPTLIIHGDDDQIVPIDVSARKAVTLLPHATLKAYVGAPHGLPTTHKDQLNADLLEFLRQ